jgi:hypothetical protein
MEAYLTQHGKREQFDDPEYFESIPDLMLGYLNELNRGVGGGVAHDRMVHRVSKVIAWECLKGTFRPTPASPAEVMDALGEGAEQHLEHLETRLRVIETVGAARDRARFVLDPLAEYLAALRLVEQLAADEDAARTFFAKADQIPGAPESIRGFLIAVRECLHFGELSTRVRDFLWAELAGRTGPVTTTRLVSS